MATRRGHGRPVTSPLVEVTADLDSFPRPARGTAVTIGAYDGVHLGHRAVLGELRRRADAGGYESVVVTFDRHPATVVRPGSAPGLLTDLDQKLELLAATGDVDLTVVIRFDKERSQEEAEHFVTSVIVDSLDAREIVVGEDFHFGRGRGGNVGLLRRLGAGMGFGVVGLGLVEVPGIDRPLSSTAIRALLGDGDVVAAARLLGRCHEVRGVVVDGDRRGRQMGFPTANVAVPPGILLPAEGIYAGWYRRPGGTDHPAAVSLGRRPTFHLPGSPPVLEAYLLDFEDDLYGEAAIVRFVARIRSEERFESPEGLILRIAQDVEDTRALLAAAGPAEA